jgi:drug/metabolite transporter (DMT)-like permease
VGWWKNPGRVHRVAADLYRRAVQQHLIAIGVALLSAVCYAVAAVLQQREASRHDMHGLELIFSLLRRPRWWMAVTSTLAGATLHVVALRFGPLTLVQPLGVSALVMALPLGAWFGNRKVLRAEWAAAGAVVLGLLAVLTLAPRHVPPPTVPSTELAIAIGCCLGVLLLCVVVSRLLPPKAAPVVRAVGSAACFGFASAMARLVVAGVGPVLIPLLACGFFAVTGMLMIQAAYRDGGLGAPLATCTIVDPVTASFVGIVLLGEHLRLGIAGGALGFAGLVLTIVGLTVLARHAHHPPNTPVEVS